MKQPEKTKLHTHITSTDTLGNHFDWREPHPPRASEGSCIKTAKPFWRCGYCGSMHPTELAEVIKAGARTGWADFKYGWPHKLYIDGAPNPYEGMAEIRSCRTEDGESIPGTETPAGPAYGKFYTVHLQEATEEEREIIERAMGLRFMFSGNSLSWTKWEEEVKLDG